MIFCIDKHQFLFLVDKLIPFHLRLHLKNITSNNLIFSYDKILQMFLIIQ